MTALHIRRNIRELLEYGVEAAKKLEDVQLTGTKEKVDGWRRKLAKAIEPN